MNNLSTEIKTHAIVTYSKAHYLLTEKQHRELTQANAGDEMVIKGSTVKVNNIADIFTIEKYYETYPERRPEALRRNFSQELRELEEKSKKEKENYPKGGYWQKYAAGTPELMDDFIKSFRQQIEEAKAKGELYQGKVRMLGLMEASRFKKYGLDK